MSFFDPQTLRYIKTNEAVARLIGAPSREALRNASPIERWPERQPNGRLSVEKLDVARVSYWSVLEDDSAISCEVLYLRNTDSFDQEFKGRRIVFAEYRAYFDELAARRTIVADQVLSHPATRDLAESHLKPLGISSLLDAPVWECGEGVGVLCHEHVAHAEVQCIVHPQAARCRR